MRRSKALSLSQAVPIITPALFIALWVAVAAHISNQVILPSVGQVVALLTHPLTNIISMGSLCSNVLVSLVRVVMGYAAAAMIAIPLGVIMGYYGLAFNLFNTFLNLFRPIPPLAWVPLVMAWFGVSSFATLLGIETGQAFIYLNNLKFAMLFIIFVGAFYPILTSTMHGVAGVNKTLIDSARVLGASERQIFFQVLIPARHAFHHHRHAYRVGHRLDVSCLGRNAAGIHFRCRLSHHPRLYFSVH